MADAFGDGAILRLADGRGNLEVVGVAAPDAAVRDQIIASLDPGVVPVGARRAFEEGVALAVSPEDNGLGDRPLLRAFQRRVGYHGSLIAPLRVRDTPIGVLSVICVSHADGHCPEDLAALAGIADRCALDIENVRLRDLLEREADERNRAVRRQEAMLEHATDVVVLVSRTGKVLDVTPAVERVLGWPRDVVLRGSVFDLVDLADRPRIAEELASVAGRPGPTPSTEFRARHADGSVRWLVVTGNSLLDDPAVEGVVITATDVTERHLAADLLTVENDVLQQVAAGAPRDRIFESLALLVEGRVRSLGAAVWLMDGDRCLLAAAPNVPNAQLSGIERWALPRSAVDALREQSADIDVFDPHTSATWEGWREHARTLGIHASWARRITDGDGRLLGCVTVYLADVREPTRHEGEVLRLATELARLVLARERASREMAYAATHDGLTGLPNRAMFLERLSRVLARSGDGGEVAVLFIDLDDFKVVNDTSGHGVGDALLRQAAERLAEVVRPVDLIARLGGDEFAVLCGGLGEAEAARVAQRILDALDTPFEVLGRRFQISASTGIAVGNALTGADAVLRDADTAMYQAKHAGRARYAVFTPDVREATVRRLALEQDLRRAIDADELSVDFQPVVSLRTGRIVGLEALARWESAEHGKVPPGEFVAVAERAGLISSLGWRVLHRATGHMADWRARGLVDDDVTVAVNVAAPQLVDPLFVTMVRETLREQGLPASGLVLEVTESAVMADLESSEVTLRQLRELGVRVAIDDFGTGHSSLARLRGLEAAVLKLDRSFIVDLDVEPSSVEMVQSVVRLAHALGKHLVAEGVELPSQLFLLRQLGADAAQGYHLARPQPAVATEGFLRMQPTWDVEPR